MKNKFELTNKLVKLKRAWRTPLGHCLYAGTELRVNLHGMFTKPGGKEQFEGVRVLGHVVVPIQYIDTVSIRYAINKTLLRKLAEMPEDKREDWFKTNHQSIDFKAFRSVYRAMATEALHKKQLSYHEKLMRLQAHAESWEPLPETLELTPA